MAEQLSTPQTGSGETPTQGSLATHYDAMPYVGLAYSATSLTRLAGLAAVKGLASPEIEGARVLEIGCGDGGNLLALATAYPKTEFVGLDASFGQISLAQQALIGARLDNCDLHCRPVEAASDDLGTFDYIIAHGVFSWITPQGRTALLKLVNDRLAQNGVAYVSYNCYPGWHDLEGLRSLLMAHTNGAEDERTRVEAVRNLLRTVAQGIAEGSMADLAPFKAIVRESLKQPDWYLAHDLVSRHNQPCYFTQFMERAEAAGLQFLGETDQALMDVNRLPKVIRDQLPDDVDPVFLGQSIDHFTHVRFRRTLLCHADQPVDHSGQQFDPEMLAYHTRLTRADKTRNLERDLLRRRADFSGPFNYRVTAAIDIAALYVLEGHRNIPLSFDDWTRKTIQQFSRLQSVVEETRVRGELRKLARRLVHHGGMVAHRGLSRAVLQPGKRPQTTPLVRYQAKSGNEKISSLVPHSVTVDATARFVLERLDGTQSLEQIADEVEQALKEKRISTTSDGATPQKRAWQTVLQIVDRARQVGLLVA